MAAAKCKQQEASWLVHGWWVGWLVGWLGSVARVGVWLGWCQVHLQGEPGGGRLQGVPDCELFASKAQAVDKLDANKGNNKG